MMKKVKKISAFLLVAVTVLCLAFFAIGCKKDGGKGEAPTSVTLVDFVDKSVDVEYGITYNVEKFVYDTDGNEYPLTASVIDGDGNSVSGDSFTVTKAKYTIVYKVNFDGEEKAKTVTVNAYNKPVINVDMTERAYNLGILPYTIPEIEVNDETDGEIENYVKEIYFEGADGEEKTSYNGTDATFTPEKTGTYYLLIKATNSKGFSNEVKIKFTVKEADLDFIPSSETSGDFFVGTKLSQFVSHADIPTEGIDNSIGYEGDALKLESVNGGSDIYVRTSLSATEYEYLSSNYIGVKVSFLIVAAVSAAEFTNNTNTGRVDGLMSAVGMDKFNTTNRNVWKTFTVPIADFAKALRTVDSDENTLFLFRPWTPTGVMFDFYLGEITLEEPKPLAADNIIASAGNAGLFHTDSNTQSTFVPKADIPTNGINNAVGYSGNALKLNLGGGANPYIDISITATELESIKDNYTGVLFRYLVIPQDGTVPTNNAADSGTHAGLISASGVANGAALPCNIWQTCIISVEQFAETMRKVDSDETTAYLFRPWLGTNGARIDFYLGDVKFLTENFAHSVEISTARELNDISSAVAGGMTLSGITYTLTEDITVDSGFTPVADTFAGDFDSNGKKVFVINGGRIFADDTMNAKVDIEIIYKIFDITEQSANDFYAGSNKSIFVSQNDIPTEGIDNSVEYGGDALKLNMGNGNLSYIKTLLSATELENISDKYDLTFSYLIVGNVAPTNNHGDGAYDGLISAAGEKGNLPINKWQTSTITLGQLIAAQNIVDTDENTAFLFRPWISGSNRFDFYLGEITLIPKTAD